jgi:hypothetical protein
MFVPGMRTASSSQWVSPSAHGGIDASRAGCAGERRGEAAESNVI